MGFTPISIDLYIKKHLKNNPSENENNLRKRLNRALLDSNNGVKCSCGNNIWVIGSASTGNSCFTCITGESFPTNEYEIDLAIKKKEKKKEPRHIDNIAPENINGFFNDEGFEINTDLINKPSLCLTCINDDISSEEQVCNMTRYGQQHDKDFYCFAYEKIKK